jgi:hypothetical protein
MRMSLRALMEDPLPVTAPLVLNPRMPTMVEAAGFPADHLGGATGYRSGRDRARASGRADPDLDRGEAGRLARAEGAVHAHRVAVAAGAVEDEGQRRLPSRPI